MNQDNIGKLPSQMDDPVRDALLDALVGIVRYAEEYGGIEPDNRLFPLAWAAIRAAFATESPPHPAPE